MGSLKSDDIDALKAERRGGIEQARVVGINFHEAALSGTGEVNGIGCAEVDCGWEDGVLPGHASDYAW